MNKQTSETQMSNILLAASLACGVAGVSAVGWSWLAGIASQWRTGTRILESLVITRDGTALIESRNRREHSASTCHTLDGESLSADATAELNSDSSRTLGDHILLSAESSRERSLPWQELVCGFAGGGSAPTYWYLIHDGHSQGHAYLAGYDVRSKRGIGYLGLAGFRLDVPPLQEQFIMEARRLPSQVACPRAWWGSAPWFSGKDRYSSDLAHLFLVSDGGLYALDLERQIVRGVPLAEEIISLDVASGPAAERPVESKYEPRILVRTTSHAFVLNLKGETIACARLPESVRDQDISVYLPTTQELIVEAQSQTDRSLDVVYWIGPGNDALRREDVRLARSAPADPHTIAWSQAVMFPSPALFSLLRFVVTPREQIEQYRAKNYSDALARSLAAAWPAILGVSILAGALAGLCYRHHRRYADRGGAAWALFVLLTGVPGAIGYWLHRRWPATERCAHCGVTVPRDRDNCLACATEFSAPAPIGTEVFA